MVSFVGWVVAWTRRPTIRVFAGWVFDLLGQGRAPFSALANLLAAFRVLDPEGKGFIRKDVMKELLTTKGMNLVFYFDILPINLNKRFRFLSYLYEK